MPTSYLISWKEKPDPFAIALKQTGHIPSNSIMAGTASPKPCIHRAPVAAEEGCVDRRGPVSGALAKEKEKEECEEVPLSPHLLLVKTPHSPRAPNPPSA